MLLGQNLSAQPLVPRLLSIVIDILLFGVALLLNQQGF
jgi:hypothetical protein